MNRNDTRDMMDYLTRLHSDLATRASDLVGNTTKAGLSERVRLQKDMDKIIKLYRVLHKSAAQMDKPARETKEFKVGTCPCGADITIGERYSLTTQAPVTIKRTCRKCHRINSVVMAVSKEAIPASWHITDCTCGAALHVRGDYAGVGFTGSHTNGRFWSRPDDYKNRTVKVDCPSCPCKWVIPVRFTVDGNGTRHRELSFKVRRCKRCQVIVERQRAAEAAV